MTKEEWLAAAQALSNAAVSLKRPDGYADALLLLGRMNAFAADAPQGVRILFTDIPNAEFQRHVAIDLERLHTGKIHLDLPRDSDERNTILQVASLIRALDEFVSEMRDQWGPTADPEAWRVEDQYIIPRLYPRRAAALKGDRRDEQGNFGNRVLIRHRILPARIGGYRVRLYPSPDRLERDAPPAYGAGLFPDLTLETPSTGERFRVDAVNCPDQVQQVSDHLAAGHAASCSVVAFPELTIDPALREAIRLGLLTAEWRAPENSWQLRLVMAGSWHETDDDKRYNTATVFDGFGEVLLQHRKLFPYSDPKLGLEDIALGEELSVLVMEDAIIAFGVCRDFCEHGDRNPYLDLDADLFLVVSYGERESMDGHLLTAKLVRIRYRAHSFVVQQDETGYPGRLGYVLTPYDGPRARTEDVAKDSAWSLGTVKLEPIDNPSDL